MKQALEALEYIHKGANSQRPHMGISWQDVSGKAEHAITALRAAIAEASMQRLTDVQQEMGQEPVAWTTMPDADDWMFVSGSKKPPLPGEWHPLFVHPPRREWVGLTDEAILLEYQTLWAFYPKEERRLAADIVKFARAIEALLKGKNS